MYHLFQYRSKCIGCNACVEVHAGRWKISRKDGKSVLIGGLEKKGVYKAVVDETEYFAARNAMSTCPVGIIKIQKI